MRRIAALWLGFWVGFGLLDYWADRRSASLCHATRWLFRTHTRVGKLTFRLTYDVGTAVLREHVLKDQI